jgi:Holliday junction resolvase
MYSWREFGREAEFVVASYLRSRGWSIALSPSSRGAADIVASKGKSLWCIQVKASTKSPHIKSGELKRLREYASSNNGKAVFATVQPWHGETHGVFIGEYTILLYSADNWAMINA